MPLEATRKSDSGLPFKVTRELPLTWLIAGIVAIAGQGVALYYGQQNLATQVTLQSADIKVLTSKVDSMIDKRNEDSRADIIRDNKIERLSDKLSSLEDSVKQRGVK